ncbi:MAG TPA: dihydrofolate reductase family protein [Marmoricola sp.]|jgi:riboflavin biosynthesis pyrimidine reductase|nr:dihydrofolate reductase family protein [Marmoricola sp.]
MRTLIGPESDDLAVLYEPPSLPWLRVNMVSTLDGAANGESGKSGSINNEADKRVFHALREQADAIVVGAGTARTERYRVATAPLVIVSHRGLVPEQLVDAPDGKVLLVTCADSPGLDGCRSTLGTDQVIVVGDAQVDLAAMRDALVERGFRNLLSEGGPHLLRDLLDADAVDELCLTWVPRVIGGVHPRILEGSGVDVPMRLAVLLEEQGTLIGRWLVERA